MNPLFAVPLLGTALLLTACETTSYTRGGDPGRDYSDDGGYRTANNDRRYGNNDRDRRDYDQNDRNRRPVRETNQTNVYETNETNVYNTTNNRSNRSPKAADQKPPAARKQSPPANAPQSNKPKGKDRKSGDTNDAPPNRQN